MKLEVQLFATRAVTDVVVTGDAHGSIAVVDPSHAVDLAARIADETAAAIRDRCYSLVQSIATAPFGESGSARLDVYENEAYQIAKDAGWLK